MRDSLYWIWWTEFVGWEANGWGIACLFVGLGFLVFTCTNIMIRNAIYDIKEHLGMPVENYSFYDKVKEWLEGFRK